MSLMIKRQEMEMKLNEKCNIQSYTQNSSEKNCDLKNKNHRQI